MKIKIISSLTKVFSDSEPMGIEVNSISMLKNERTSFQVVLFSQQDCKADISVDGFENRINLFKVCNVPVKLASFDNTDDYYLKKEEGLYPDILLPFDGETEIKSEEWTSLWVELFPDGTLSAGQYNVNISITCGGETFSQSVFVEIIDAYLPKIDFVYTNWYHCDGICNYYNVPVFSDEFWKINRNFIKTAVEHGMNCILTPLFTPPLDTGIGLERLTIQLVDVKFNGKKFTFGFNNLKKWIDMCRECGIEYFELSHLFTQWGALHAPKVIAKDKKGRVKKLFGWETRPYSRKYDAFLLQLGSSLIKFLEREGIKDKCFVHVSDEPSKRHLVTYRRRAEIIKKAFPGFTVIDALSDFEIYKSGALSQPIPETGNADVFYGNVPSLWVYYCCGQGREYLSNRFISMPSQRTRVLGCQLYKYDVKGFLQWGYNFYNTQYSKESIDPYKVTDAGAHFPAGDAFMVYPGKNGDAVSSLRLKVFYDAFQDFRAFKLLESYIGRDKVIDIMETSADCKITFRDYPHSENWQLELRKKVNNLIKDQISK